MFAFIQNNWISIAVGLCWVGAVFYVHCQMSTPDPIRDKTVSKIKD